MFCTLEQTPKVGNVAQEWSFNGGSCHFGLKNPAKYNRFTIANEHLGGHRVRIDRWDTISSYLTPGVLIHTQIHDDLIIRRNLGRNFKRQCRFFKRGGCCTT